MEDDFCLELSKVSTYDDVTERVARHLGLDDPTKIRLTAHNCFSQKPKLQSIEYQGIDHLSEMLIHHNRTSDILYYEVLDIPLPELQDLKTLNVAFSHSTKIDTVFHSIRLRKQSTEIPEEKNMGPQDRLIHVYHFTNVLPHTRPVENFGEPFLLVIHDGETLMQSNWCIQKKLQVPDEEFAKWKFASLSLLSHQPEYLDDSDIVLNHFQKEVFMELGSNTLAWSILIVPRGRKSICSL
ncbi:hypothetical protein MKW92_032898 [Papaver armeniacum]|nr:hypothetical protein MKW92_032898 [Papaver armeniacum]